MLAFIACLVTMVDIVLVPKREKFPPSVSLIFLGLAFVGCTVLSFIASTTKSYGFDEVIQTASFFLLFRFSLCVPAYELQHVRSRFARILSIAMLVACAIGIAVYVLQPVGRFVGTFFDYRFDTDYWPNAWAEFLLFAWPLLIWSLWGRKMKAREPHAKILVMGLLLACFFLSYSRGAFIAMLLQSAFLLLIIFMRVRLEFPWRCVLRNVTSVLVASLLTFTLINHVRSRFNPVQSVLEKATFTASEGTSSITERKQFWSQAIEFAKQKPIFGFGPYSFRFLQPHLQREVLATSDHPHNVFLKLSMERGAVSALLLLIIIAWCCVAALKRVMHKKEDGSSVLTILLLTSVLGVLLHNLIDYNLQFVGICAPFWVALGLLADRNPTRKDVWLVNVICVLVAFALFILAVSEGRYLLLSSSARKAERMENHREALRLYSLTDRSLFPRDSWLSRAGILLTNGTAEAAQKAIDEGMKMNAQDFRLWKLQGDLFLKKKDSKRALEAFEKAYAYGRYDDLGITRMLIELLKNDRLALDARRNEFELLLNDFGLAIENNVHFIDLSSNVEELQKICMLLASIYPADASAYIGLSERSTEHAMLERAHLKGRARGLLW